MSDILLGTVGSDIHSVANTLLEKELLDAKFSVKNLGVAVAINEWEQECRSFNYDLVLVGTLNGDLLPLIEVLRGILQFVSPSKILVGGKFNLGSEGMSNAPLLYKMGINLIENEEASFTQIVETCTRLLLVNSQIEVNQAR